MMKIDEVEGWIDSFRKQPLRTITFIVILFIVGVFVSYSNGCFEQIGKQHASSPSMKAGIENEHKQPVLEERANHKSVITQTGKGDQSKTTTINQQTQGSQSPAIVSGGDVKIEYNSPKNKK